MGITMVSVARRDQRANWTPARLLFMLIVVSLIGHLWMQVSHAPRAGVLPLDPAHAVSSAPHDDAHGSDYGHHSDRHVQLCTARQSNDDPVTRNVLRRPAMTAAEHPRPVTGDPGLTSRASQAARTAFDTSGACGAVLLL